MGQAGLVEMPSKLSYLPNVLKLFFEATEDSSILFHKSIPFDHYKKRGILMV